MKIPKLRTKKFYNIGPKLERLARGKHSSLLRKFVAYGRKKFYNIGPWLANFLTWLKIIKKTVGAVNQHRCRSIHPNDTEQNTPSQL
jgi:hypothetical protein